MLLAVDIGNSSTKVGWFDLLVSAGELPTPRQVRDYPTGEPLPGSILADLSAGPVVWRIASVQRAGEQVLADWVREQRPADDFRILTHRDLPLEVRVDFPDRVGLDRLAAVLAASRLLAERSSRQAGQPAARTPAIVIDAGTAITVDLLDMDGAFAGGVILPGFRLTAQALAGGTNLLPLCTFTGQDQPPPVVGKNTQAAIASGLFWGAVGAVREIISRISADLPTLPAIFVTGGDLRHLAPLVSDRAQFIPHLVLRGIAIATSGERADG